MAEFDDTQKSSIGRPESPLNEADTYAMDDARSIFCFIEMDEDTVPPRPAVSICSVMAEDRIARYEPSLRTAEDISALDPAKLTLQEFEAKIQSAIKDKGTDDPEGQQLWVQVDDETFTDCLRLEDCEFREVAEIIKEGHKKETRTRRSGKVRGRVHDKE
jgi:hypothetical protein